MLQQEPCQGCDHHHACRQIYARIGSTKGPSVILKTLMAFLLPLCIFIASLAIFRKILYDYASTERSRTLQAFFPALAVTVLLMSAIILITRRTRRGN